MRRNGFGGGRKQQAQKLAVNGFHAFSWLIKQQVYCLVAPSCGGNLREAHRCFRLLGYGSWTVLRGSLQEKPCSLPNSAIISPKA